MEKQLTKEGLERLKKELEYLEKTKRKEVAEKMKEAIAQGDLSENAGYEAAKEEQSFIEGKIRELKSILADSKVIVERDGDHVRLGLIVVLESDDGKEEFQIVDPEEADVFKNKISFKSPLGASLLGRKKGEVVKSITPRGKKEYTILEIK